MTKNGRGAADFFLQPMPVFISFDIVPLRLNTRLHKTSSKTTPCCWRKIADSLTFLTPPRPPPPKSQHLFHFQIKHNTTCNQQASYLQGSGNKRLFPERKVWKVFKYHSLSWRVVIQPTVMVTLPLWASSSDFMRINVALSLIEEVWEGMVNPLSHFSRRI